MIPCLISKPPSHCQQILRGKWSRHKEVAPALRHCQITHVQHCDSHSTFMCTHKLPSSLRRIACIIHTHSKISVNTKYPQASRWAGGWRLYQKQFLMLLPSSSSFIFLLMLPSLPSLLPLPMYLSMNSTSAFCFCVCVCVCTVCVFRSPCVWVWVIRLSCSITDSTRLPYTVFFWLITAQHNVSAQLAMRVCMCVSVCMCVREKETEGSGYRVVMMRKMKVEFHQEVDLFLSYCSRTAISYQKSTPKNQGEDGDWIPFTSGGTAMVMITSNNRFIPYCILIFMYWFGSLRNKRRVNYIPKLNIVFSYANAWTPDGSLSYYMDGRQRTYASFHKPKSRMDLQLLRLRQSCRNEWYEQPADNHSGITRTPPVTGLNKC